MNDTNPHKPTRKRTVTKKRLRKTRSPTPFALWDKQPAILDLVTSMADQKPGLCWFKLYYRLSNEYILSGGAVDNPIPEDVDYIDDLDIDVWGDYITFFVVSREMKVVDGWELVVTDMLISSIEAQVLGIAH